MPEFDELLIERIRRGDAGAWQELISRFEGRLLAFVERRLRQSSAAEDVVQETFVGFLNSLPNYDARRSLESYLFTIAAHKLTDHLRREGRRPAIPLAPMGSSLSDWDPPSPHRGPSSILRSGERSAREETVLARALSGIVAAWRERGDWQKIQCAELLFVRGYPNKEAARLLGISEQTVANYKHDIVARLKKMLDEQGLPASALAENHE